jgi:hypothetical protein
LTVIAIGLGVLIALALVLLAFKQPSSSHAKTLKENMRASNVDNGSGVGASTGTCPLHSCGALDPVSDPEYNMKEIIKQSLMLEEHLVEKNKRCKDCQAKHFLMIIGLSEEALSLAGAKIGSYPLMGENPKFYNEVFEAWLANKDSEDDAVFLALADRLRMRRKELVAVYVLGNI